MKSLTSIAVTAITLISSVSAYAQFQGDIYRQYNDAQVKSGSNTMALPWTGGVNQPQLAMADLNRDGRKDIVLFEEYIGLKTLIATGTGAYKYDSKYEASFPEIYGYLKLIDFNGDGIEDLVHRSFSGVGVSYGYYNNNQLHFRFYKDLYYLGGSGWTNAYVAPQSIPGMDDVDGDGDIDIVAYDVWGSTITMYQNCTKEDNLPADSIKICLKDWCWGRTIQNYERKQVLGYSCPWSIPTCKGCGPGGKGTHGSNTLLLIDMDNDGDLDWFNGNESFSDIQFFFNGKAEFGVDSAIAEDTIWSANGVPMIVDMYPGAYALDVNHNGVRDLLFTPMNRQSANYNSIVLYENTGTEANKNYVYKSNTYLVDRMIDMGQGSYPVFYDYDKDGKKDLFIGSEGFYQHSGNYNRSKIAYYRNTTTTPTNYSFELITDDFMGLWAKDYRGASLAIGDLDNDTLDDLIIGHTDGTFSFYKNTAASNTVTPVWTLVSDTMMDLSTFTIMDVGDYATPAIYDINGDGKNDLVSGNQFGALYYYRNYSSVPGTIGLTKVTDTLGGIKLNSPVDPYSYTAPYIGPTDNTGKDYLVVGTNWGSLYRYDGFQNGVNPAKYTMIDSSYSYIRGHKRIAPAFANVDADNNNLHELVLGNVLGGLIFYKQDFKVGITDKVAGNTDVLVYPNPADKILNINWGKDFNEGGVQVQLISVTGQVMMKQSYDAVQLSGSFDISALSAGMYYCIVQSGPNRSVQPVTVLK
jgi:hypothetical protein